MSTEFHTVSTNIPEVVTINSNLFSDDRGYFYRSYDKNVFRNEYDFDLSQINICLTKEVGTIRGLHYQTEPFREQKIVRCISGSILDVAVDIRPKSPTYLQHVQIKLSAANNLSLLIPKGFAHGYQTLVQDSIVHYCTSEVYTPNNEKGLRFNDPKLNIKWDLKITNISVKDGNWPLLQ